MSFALRPYQQKFVNEIRESIKYNKYVIACSATGSGKSKTFISISRGSIEHNRTVLIISESTSIYRQIHTEIGNTINIGDGVQEFYLEPNKIYVAMAQTLVKRPGLIAQFNRLGDKLLIISDEAHVGTATNLLLQLREAYLIGFTASPNFTDAKHLPTLYKDIVVGAQPQELVELGFLSPYFHFERQIADLSGLKKSGKDYSEQSQEKVFEKKEVYDGIIEDLKKFKFFKCMVFCASIKHCNETANKLKEAGYEISVCHSKNKNSDYELFNFTNGSNSICVSCGSLTKGFNFDSIDLIILNRATSSLSLYLQMVGRGSRIDPPTAKSRFTVIDFGGNGTRHKPWNYEHDWSKMWNQKLKKSEGVAPVKVCRNCGFMMPAKVQICPACQYENPVIITEEEKKQTQLVELTEKYNKLRGRKISTLSPHELFEYTKITNKKHFAKRIAVARGTEFLEQYARYSKWNYGWWDYIVADTSLEYNDIIIK